MGSGRVLQAGLASRPDDGRVLLKVATDAAGPDNAIWLDRDAASPPGGALVTWDAREAWWTDAGGREVRARKRGFAFDDHRPWLG